MNLRQRIRGETAGRHRYVDELYSSLEFSSAADRRRFLVAHRMGFGAMALARPPKREGHSGGLIDRIVTALDADLRELGCCLPRVPKRVIRRWDVTARDYIVLGSRLGSRVLASRWAAAGQNGGRRYFAVSAPPGIWRAFCRELERRPAAGDEADSVIRDACGLFDLMAASFHAASTSPI